MRKLTASKIIAKVAIGTAVFTMLASLLIGQHAMAADTKPTDPNPPPMPPSALYCWKVWGGPKGSGTMGEAQWAGFYGCLNAFQDQTLDWRQRVDDWWYRRSEKIMQETENSILLATMGGVMDAIAYMTTNFAYDSANKILGVESPDGRPTFWEDNFGDYLKYHTDKASGVFFERFDAMHEFSADFGSGDQTEFGFTTLCNKPSPLDIQLGFGFPGIPPLSPGTCTFSKMVENFEAIGDMVSSEEALTMHREGFNPNGNDFHVGLELHSNYTEAILGEHSAAKLTRQETEGMHPIIDKVTQKITWPSMLANESMRSVDPVAMAMRSQDQREDYMISTFIETGISGIGIVTVQTFASRLALGFLEKLLAPDPEVSGSSTGDTQKYNIIFQSLVNEDATGDTQNFYERQAFAKALGDFIIPSYFSQKDKDLISELSLCPNVRSKWNCAMDQQLAIAIGMGTTDGALTIGKAAGIGNENATVNPNSTGLHADWELIPESDIANNTDPSCYQRAYCAGNLKKLRLARILPIGFEMAANSPYNAKHNGSYVTLGEVIRGFYNCNEDGELDKDHPWCHLIDPNWILAAPKYQCRSEGYGNSLMPEIGTRLEECGDMVTCLGTDQTGDCNKGYGYCLAERPVYKFDAPECDAHYASCRTYVSSQGEDLSALRYTVERGACTQENIGCMWYSTLRYAPTADTADGLWVGTLNDGPRVYLDGTAEPCAAAGCTKALNVEVGEQAFNLIQNGSFEDVVETEQNGEMVLQEVDAWDSTNAIYSNIDSTSDSYNGARSLTLESADNDVFIQALELYPNRNYVLSFYFKSKENYGTTSGHVNIDFFNDEELISANRITTEPANFEDCYWDGSNNRLTFNEAPGDQQWHRLVCQFVSPVDVKMARVYINLADFLYIDALQLEEGEYATDYIDEAADLEESHIKIAPDEYQCTGNDDEDHPACAGYARVCRQTEVGCQGYTSVNDPTAPEIPATLTAKDYCPSVCSGYGEYRKLASSFDLVENLIHPEFSDPTDDGRAYLIPGTATACTLQEVGCEPFTNMEASQEGGETVAYYDELRSCQKPNDLSRTYFTWEGSDEEGYVLRTWALIAESDTSNKPAVMLKGAEFGDIKDPDSCDEDLWSSGADQDCRQFYDEAGEVYYAYYSQTISSDDTCTLYRKDDSSQIDCEKTGGHEYLPESRSCLYYALPEQSSLCGAAAGGCRAYLGPTGRNAVQTYFQSFAADGSEAGFSSTAGSIVTRSEETVLVGDYSLRVDSGAGSAVQAQVDIPINSTSSLYRVSFWAKALQPEDLTVSIDGQSIGTVKPTLIWQRFELGPFEVEDATSTLSFAGPAAMGSLFIDTVKFDQLNDVRFLVKNSWTIPAACDATAEGTPEPRAMLGCAEYVDRDGNQIFAKSFSNLCRADSIGCKAFIDTRSVSNPYPETRTITGTPGPSPREDADAKAYEEQYLGDWSVTSPAWRYYYAIDDARARCDESQDSCRAFGKPVFTQDRLSLEPTDVTIDPNNPANAEILQNQDIIYEFDTVMLKHDWDAYYNDDESLNLACRKDELHCEKYQSGNVTEYFRDPGNHTCEWSDGKQISANPEVGIYTAGTYGGWFRSGTDIPCYPGDDALNKAPYLKNGTNFGAYFTGEDQYTGWVSKCPVDQSECTEFVDPNDTSDSDNSTGRSYYLINSRQIDTNSCGGTAEPLAGCVLFNNKNISDLFANSQATYDLIQDERGAAQTPIDCEADPGNPHCRFCTDYVIKSPTFPQQQLTMEEIVSIVTSAAVNQTETQKYSIELLKYENRNNSCNTDADCIREGIALFPSSMPNKPQVDGFVVGTCGRKNDSNVVIKVKLDRECARWMGCATGETIYDQAQQKYVTQCSDLQLCERNSSVNDDIYCADFTDRNTEEVLTPAQFVSMQAYSSRQVGYGSMDYSGYTIPNQYLLSDIQSRAVGSDILTGDTASRYEQDKRLVAQLPIIADGPIEVLDPNPSYPNLNLCRDTRTGRIGYILEDTNCYLSINEPQALSYVAGGGQGTDVSRDITEIYKYFLEQNTSRQNSLLQSAMPSPECQLFPEETSPLPNAYVIEWNEKSNPPLPVEIAGGFDNANACVYGEDCSCSYRKVRYQTGLEQYYAVDGRAPAIGICVGGDNEGEACVPGGFVPVNAADRVIANASQQFTAQEASQCGGTSICASIQDVVIHNGLYGYCLERDRTRTDGVSQDSAPCLTWSPMAVVGGKYDTKHNAPTAGYLPPQGSGEYYCMSGANEQRLETPSTLIRHDAEPDNSAFEDFWMPGELWEFAFARNEVWWAPKESKSSNIAIDGKNNITFIGSEKEETLDNIIIEKDKNGDPLSKEEMIPSNKTKNLRFACRRTTICEGRPNQGDDYDFNDKEGRWIMTGDSITNSYMEYFIPSGPGIDWINENHYDYNYGLFRFGIMPYAAGSACKWNPKWVGMDYPAIDQSEGQDFSCQAYLQQIQQNSQHFYSQFTSNFPGVLDRSSEEVLRDEQGIPVRLQCAIGTDGSCYYKYWETGYQNSGQEQFRWPFTISANNLENFNFKEQYKSYYAHECNSSSPYFGIRAVFQNVNKRDNRLQPDEAKNNGFEGPWQFIGFWFTTCLPTERPADPGWLYMRMDTVTADVCREVGQVISPESREKAAFMDRVWSQGNFLLPVLGLTYESRNEPHGSALATAEIGSDPMLLGASVPTSGALNKAPGFIDSGLTTAAILSQQNTWVPLTNLFARVYKVYRWDPNAVESGDWTCVKGSQKGKPCPDNANNYQGLEACGEYATCDPDIDVNIKNQNWRCNTLSGVNRGLHCGDIAYPARNTDPICHNAAMQYEFDSVKLQATLTPLLTSCEKMPDRQREAIFSIPLQDFGTCQFTVDDGKWQRAWCWREEESQIKNGFEPDEVIKFKMINCTNNDKYFAHPIRPEHADGTPIVAVDDPTQGPFQSSHEFDLWHQVYNMMLEAITKSGATNINLDTGTATCGDDPIRPDGEIITALKNQMDFVQLQAELEPYGYPGIDALDRLYDNNNMPQYFELGYFSQETADALSVNRCYPSAVNAGAQCANISGNSMECPQRIEACGSQAYEQIKQDIDTYLYDLYGPDENCFTCQPPPSEYPPCGYCTTNDPQSQQKIEDPYRDVYPGTGFCKGKNPDIKFNPLSRCKTNEDCTFTEFEFWGTEDLGGATGRRFTDEGAELISYSDGQGLPLQPEVFKEDMALPMLLFKTQLTNYTNKLPDSYQEPAKFEQIGTGSGDYEEEFLNWYPIDPSYKHYGLDTTKNISEWGKETTYCQDNYWHNVCYAIYKHFEDTFQKEDPNDFFRPFISSILHCESFCERAYQLSPNGYAELLDSIVDTTVNKKQRTAAVAPFAVNPKIRSTLSRGHAAIDYQKDSGNNGIKMKMLYYFIAGNPHGGNYYQAPNVFYNSGFLDPVDIAESIAYYYDGANNQKRLNDTFPWRADKLFFTTIFPLAVNNGTYSQPESVDIELPDRGYFFDKYWEGYGMSRELFELYKKMTSYIQENTGNNDPEIVEERLTRKAAYENQALVDMQENFYKKTGWGTFLTSDDSKLQLYPGAIPAAVPREEDREEYTVYIPGHCEPPIGGTDTDSVDGEAESIVLINQGDPVVAGFPDIWSGLDEKADWGDGDGSDHLPLLMPWSGIDFNDEEYQLDADKYGSNSPEKYTWTEPYVQPKVGVEAMNIPITCENCSTVINYRNTCRCVGGKRNGTVQESQYDCNIGLPDALNPDKMPDPLGFPSEYCKANATYIDDEWVPIPECQAPTGVRNHEDPDLDDNMCTHRAGYVPRGDVCADGRDDCLVTYNVSDPVSTDHVNKSDQELAAPSATDVTSGLDTFWYLTGGKVQRLNREYSAWYRPRPPQVAAPDMTRAGSNSNAQPLAIVDAFSVDGLPSGLVYYGGGRGLATIRFYAWAMHNQGPLDSIIVDWGDGTVQEITNAQMKNSKPVCNTDKECEFVPGLACGSDADCPPGAGACMPIGNCKKQAYKTCREDIDCGNDDSCEPRIFFGNSTQACRQGYFEFQHVYRCNDKSLSAYESVCGTTGRCSKNTDITCSVNTDCPRPDEECVTGLAQKGGCYIEALNRCRYTPRIQVRDSWGWCTGDCSKDDEPYPGGPFIPSSAKDLLTRHPYGGCYDGSETKINTEVMNWTGGAKPDTLINECSMDSQNDILTPWVIFDGAVEIEDTTEVTGASSGGVGGLNIQVLPGPGGMTTQQGSGSGSGGSGSGGIGGINIQPSGTGGGLNMQPIGTGGIGGLSPTP
ncbi:hypothetical protein GF391_00605 [Candidatus Uhrbacteria bacterium]|nr:hypothetical protein [Candidatus Uhrbacteria bacterium]